MAPLVSFQVAGCHGETRDWGEASRCRGFTLVELMVVLAVMAMLAALLFPVVARVREKGRQATCLSNLRQIAAAHLLYLEDWDERFPPWRQEGPPPVEPLRFGSPQVESLGAKPPRANVYWTELLQPYLRCLAVFRDPSFAWPPWPVPGEKLADYALLTWGPDGRGTVTDPYWCWPGPQLTLGQVVRPAETCTVMDGYTATGGVGCLYLLPHSGGMNASFVDGHAHWLPAGEQWRLGTNGRGFYWWHYATADH